MFEPIQVMRGGYAQEPLFGPLPGVRLGSVATFEFELPSSFEPKPGRTLLERTFVLLDLGVSFANPCWIRHTRSDGTITDTSEGGDFWYVDLITVEQAANLYTFRDLYIDVMVPTDGRHYRMLDLEEFADAIQSGSLPIDIAIEAPASRQAFLDRHLHAGRYPSDSWTDFPPTAIRPLQELPPFGEPVRWHD